jgi:hypothetical protein
MGASILKQVNIFRGEFDRHETSQLITYLLAQQRHVVAIKWRKTRIFGRVRQAMVIQAKNDQEARTIYRWLLAKSYFDEDGQTVIDVTIKWRQIFVKVRDLGVFLLSLIEELLLDGCSLIECKQEVIEYQDSRLSEIQVYLAFQGNIHQSIWDGYSVMLKLLDDD